MRIREQIMGTPPPSTVVSRLGTVIFFLSCLAALLPEVAGVLLLLEQEWVAWLRLTAAGVAIVFVSSTLNFLLTGCFIPGCRG